MRTSVIFKDSYPICHGATFQFLQTDTGTSNRGDLHTLFLVTQHGWMQKSRHVQGDWTERWGTRKPPTKPWKTSRIRYLGVETLLATMACGEGSTCRVWASIPGGFPQYHQKCRLSTRTRSRHRCPGGFGLACRRNTSNVHRMRPGDRKAKQSTGPCGWSTCSHYEL